MFNGKIGIPELLVVLLGAAPIVAGVWLTRKSRQSSSHEISQFSVALIALGFGWCWLVSAGGWQARLFSNYTLGGVLGISLLPLLLTLCVFLLGKRKKDPNVSARWFFWSIYVATLISNVLGKT